MDKVDYFLEEMEKRNPVHYRQINKIILNFDSEWREFTNTYLIKFEEYLKEKNRDFIYGIESYLKVVNDTMMEQYDFMKRGEYSCKSFKDAYEKVYSNSEVMEYYMTGLMFTQLFWKNHYETFRYFSKNIEQYLKEKSEYLEIGGGHGLFVTEVIKNIQKKGNITLVDISETSLEMAKIILKNRKINYILSDIFDIKNEAKYDFITMGEVLEHVEQPKELLKKIYSLLIKNGMFFITVPINSPAIDHIYLFKKEEEIREMIKSIGFKIEEEIVIKSENIKPELEEKLKISKMYCAFLKK